MAGAQKPSTDSSTTGREDYLKYDDFFMATAVLAAKRSKDPNTQVGACIVNQEKKIVGIGHNDMPNGIAEGELPWARNAKDKTQLDAKYLYVCHAELNAIVNKNSADVKGCTMYVTFFPCNECAKLIIQSGIKDVVYFSDAYADRNEFIASRRMLDLAGVVLKPFETEMTSEIRIDIKPKE
ncbi:deoxycytidylate deaminase-like [Centropristis striata]|uniref:deoxycytidylate deaminase-like n=1 Tax=Centropristis striata TaxID=184440 RepID=UPI0027DF0FCD|nr:deoxycytidylate deaminase-like [Centropristis striata]